MKQIHFLLKKYCLCFFLIAIFCSIQFNVKAQALDSKGTDFWVAFTGNYNGGAALSLFISADQNTTGTVTVPGIGYSVPFTVTVGTVTTISLPASAEIGSGSDVVTNKGVHIVSAKEVTVYGLSRIVATTDAFLALPTDILGTDYINLGYKNVDIVNGTQFGIVATTNATTVTITPTVTTGSRIANVPYTITLNQGETYQLRNTNSSPSDLSGSLISSNKPIAVFGSHQCANIPNNSTLACDYVVEELPPTSAWGKNFVTVPLKTRIGGDTFRFLASTNGTSVKINGIVVATLNRGQFFETILTTYSQVTSTQPILVAQYSNGTTYDNVTSDPFMMLITPYEQFLGNYTFATPATGFRFNFVNVVAPANAVNSLKLDGVAIPSASFTPIGSTGFSGAQLAVTLGAHTINGTNLPFGIFVYGFDDADSYGYPGGQSLSPIATVTSVTLSPKTGTATVGTNQCFDALVKDQFNNPVVGVRVDFNITGANPVSTGFVNTDAGGTAHFCYVGTNAGTDNLIASVGTISDAGSFVWTPAVVATDYYSKPTGDLHNVLTWGVNMDGSGANPPDFGAGKTFHLVNRVPTYMMTADWTVGGTIDVPAGSQLQIKGFTLSEAQLMGTGSLYGSTTSNLIVTGTAGSDAGPINFAAGGNSLNNFTLNRTGPSASATVVSALDINGVLTVTNGSLNTGNNITLKSNVVNTARVAPVTGSITGNVTVERYIPARRAWRLLAAPVGNMTASAVVTLNNTFENPPTAPTTTGGTPRPASYGTATFALNNAHTALTFSATIYNIDFTGMQTTDVNDNLVAAHIHAGPTITPTTNGPVVWGFFGAPLNDNNPNDVVITPFTNGVGGTISGKWDLPEGNSTTLAAQLPNLMSGHAYINFHTTQFGGGEIRGNISLVSDGPQSINMAWQEGATTFSSNPNPNPGFGTHITQSVSNGADGLDFNSAIAMSSLKVYQNTNNTWVPVLNTNTTPVNSNAWFTFVRGDRSINMGYNTVAPNNTVLRSMGALKTGDQSFPINATGLTSIANPYASPINFATIAANNPNINNSFTVVDPKLGSTGAFVNVSFNGSTYDVTPAAASPINQFIQSGQGFLVQSNGTGGNVIIREADKSATNATDVFRVSANTSAGLRVNLQAINNDTAVVLDEAFSSYNDNFSNKVDGLDALKAENQEENLAIITDEQTLMVDRRKPVSANDLIKLKLWNTTERDYVLSFNPINLASISVPVFVVDNYLKTSTPIDLNKETKIPFMISSNAASKNPYRFEVVFSDKKDLYPPVTSAEEIRVWPNPVENKVLNIQLHNQLKGTYQVQLIDNLGRIAYQTKLVHPGGFGNYSLKVTSAAAKGLYQVKVSQGTTVKTLKVLIN